MELKTYQLPRAFPEFKTKLGARVNDLERSGGSYGKRALSSKYFGARGTEMVGGWLPKRSGVDHLSSSFGLFRCLRHHEKLMVKV